MNPAPEVKSEAKVGGDIIVRVDQGVQDWLESLYNQLLSDEDLVSIYDAVRYKGFDRKLVLAKLYKTLNDKKQCTEAIILCALRGPQAAAKTKMSNGRTLESMGIRGSGGKGSEDLTCQRITAATADLACYYLKRLNVPKRIGNHELPGWLQNPSAGSIDLPPRLRELHRDFSIRFSKIIGGEFNEQIYDQMMANAYLSPNLNLFQQ